MRIEAGVFSIDRYSNDLRVMEVNGAIGTEKLIGSLDALGGVSKELTQIPGTIRAIRSARALITELMEDGGAVTSFGAIVQRDEDYLLCRGEILHPIDPATFTANLSYRLVDNKPFFFLEGRGNGEKQTGAVQIGLKNLARKCLVEFGVPKDGSLTTDSIVRQILVDISNEKGKGELKEPS